MQDGQRLLLNFRDTLKTTTWHLQFDSREQEEIGRTPNEARRAGEGFTALFLEATYCCRSVHWHYVQGVFDGLVSSDFAALPCRHDAKASGLEGQVPDVRPRSHKERHQHCPDVESALPRFLRTC